jgi:hypothetical protein
MKARADFGRTGFFRFSTDTGKADRRIPTLYIC